MKETTSAKKKAKNRRNMRHEDKVLIHSPRGRRNDESPVNNRRGASSSGNGSARFNSREGPKAIQGALPTVRSAPVAGFIGSKVPGGSDHEGIKKKGRKRRRQRSEEHQHTARRDPELVDTAPSSVMVSSNGRKRGRETSDVSGHSSTSSGRQSRPNSRASLANSRGAAPQSRLSDLQKRMRHKLEGAQFRMINEALYTSESGASLAKFRKEPDLFDVYHRGFREQVEKWPVDPLDIIIEWLARYPKARVADFGCGEARLAASVPNRVHSFDLVAPNPRVTACDMAHVPLKDSSVHVAVFCLSLMGTNLADFLREAHRVLVPGGLVKVAEVRSRFEGEEGGVERFFDAARRLGFDRKEMDRTNTMFLLAEFQKSIRRPEEGIVYEAKACIYKRR